METIVTIAVILFVLSLIFYVEKIMYRKGPTEKEIIDYQKLLNASAGYINSKPYTRMKVLAEIHKKRKEIKYFSIFISGILLQVLLFCKISISNMVLVAICGLFLICYGIIQWSEQKKYTLFMIFTIISIGLITFYIFDKIAIWFLSFIK
jgi:hypothetical protein